MILTAGWCKGLRLKSPPGDKTRPTSAKLRESLLNILADRLEDGVFVDLFAGTGSVGLSALSRGAQGAVFVEKDKAAVGALRANVAEAARRAEKQGIKVNPLLVLDTSVEACWDRLTQTCEPTIVWADPPYALTADWLRGSEKSLKALVKPGGILAVEADSKQVADLTLSDLDWEVIRNRAFADSSIIIWQRKGE